MSSRTQTLQTLPSTRPAISVPSVVLMFALLAAASYGALIWAPEERTMGIVQRIFYFHVASAWSGFVSFIMVFIGSVSYLRTRALKWDWLSVASAEVGVAFFTVVLVTGPIWAKPVWGIWWTWDARLTSSFLLWVLFVSYLVLRSLVEEPERRAMVSAVFGIFAALDIPLVYFSIWWFRTQHPQPVIGDGGKLDSRMGWVLLLTWAATSGVMIVLIRLRYRLEALRAAVDALRMESARTGD
ncbi:MAG TPA: cytochrome c biogenesis protein CcsA [Candidatus Acidoferrales bacterium]|nr:cytochrome c biogenesis protein CcsA [Candidatus Acidoferrales bacterium]